MALITGVHHIAMKCCNQEEYEKTLKFYTETLGLPVARVWDGGIMLDTGSGLLEIFTNGETPLPQGAIRHFALATGDVDACVAAVEKDGYKVFMGPKDITIPATPVFPARIAFCIGPLGEEIEFFCEK